jgi:hypothetical protein
MKTKFLKIHNDDFIFSIFKEGQKDIPKLPGRLGEYTAREMMNPRKYPEVFRYLEREFFAPARQNDYNYREIRPSDLEELVSNTFGSSLGRFSNFEERRRLREKLINDFVSLINAYIKRKRQEKEKLDEPRRRLRFIGPPPTKFFNKRK